MHTILKRVQVLDDLIFTDQRDFLDSFDEDMAAMISQDFENCLAGGNSSPTSSSMLINDVSGDANTSLCGGAQLLQNPNSCSKFSTTKSVPDPDRASSTPVILKFGNASSSENPQPRPLNPDEMDAISEILRSKAGPFADPEAQFGHGQMKKTRRVRPASQTYDHIVAERKRRELLSQRFLALSAIVPGLKKMDKTSVLGDAIKYLKHLQERVKTLEEQATKQTMESAVLVKRSLVTAEDESSTDGEGGSYDEHPLPEIEARVCNNHILLRVHCEKHKGVLVDLLSKVEELNLAILHTNVATFGSLALDITIIADMETEFNLTAKDVVKRLRAGLRR
ncbi:UNVERIFIED_CONTAM: Transcription factor [Sesamum calycinum]|uniref:Transcription factor n=1 Tax=Sesamum calycinum TaxID=2727403 RepID=A0AAW2SU86_9LAMI